MTGSSLVKIEKLMPGTIFAYVENSKAGCTSLSCAGHVLEDKTRLI